MVTVQVLVRRDISCHFRVQIFLAVTILPMLGNLLDCLVPLVTVQFFVVTDTIDDEQGRTKYLLTPRGRDLFRRTQIIK